MTGFRPFESTESAAPIITRLVAGVLRGKPERGFEFAAWERLGLRLLNLLPPAVARWAVRWHFSRTSLMPSNARLLAEDELAAQRLRDYKGVEGKFPVVVVGSALAGAAAHLAALLRGPFLPQPFILGMRGGSPDDDLTSHLALATSVAREILDRNQNLKAIAHFDPIHDGWLTRTVTHLRLKLVGLPRAYEAFLLERLEPGGTILYLDCGSQWLHFPISERLSCQIGGWGGIPADEYISGSERIDRFLQATGSAHRGGWRVPGIEAHWAPESEWGSDSGLDEALGRFAEKNGYRFVRLHFPHPHDYSRLAFRAHRALFDQIGQEVQGIVVETFTQYDPYIVLRAGLLPLWLVFNTIDSLEFMQDVLAEVSVDHPLYFSGLSTLSRTPDMVPWETWAAAFEGRSWVNIGAGPRRYPEDMVALFNWSRRLENHVPGETEVELPSLPLEDFLRLLPDVAE